MFKKTKNLIIAGCAMLTTAISCLCPSFINDKEEHEQILLAEKNEAIGPELPTFVGTQGYSPSQASFHENSKFAIDYFTNLEEYLPINNVGNCGYISMAMVLSYYAFYWNPRFIDIPPLNYWPKEETPLTEFNSITDKMSPCARDTDFELPDGLNKQAKENADNPLGNFFTGLIQDPYAAMGESSSSTTNQLDLIDQKALEAALDLKKDYDEYFNKKVDNFPDSLIAYLYRLADAYGIWDRQKKPNPALTMDELEEILSVFVSDVGLSNNVTVIHKNFQSYKGYSDDEKRDAMHEEMLKLVEDGKPLIIGGTLMPRDEDGNLMGLPFPPGTKLSGHATVAYFCKEDKLWGHAGWKGYSRQDLDELYYQMNDFSYLEFSKTDPVYHEHNSQFAVQSGYHCSCCLSSHNHIFDALEIPGNDTIHMSQCMCGLTQAVGHSFTPYVAADSQYHQKTCECGHTIKGKHSYDPLALPNQKKCKTCGYKPSGKPIFPF